MSGAFSVLGTQCLVQVAAVVLLSPPLSSPLALSFLVLFFGNHSNVGFPRLSPSLGRSFWYLLGTAGSSGSMTWMFWKALQEKEAALFIHGKSQRPGEPSSIAALTHAAAVLLNSCVQLRFD